MLLFGATYGAIASVEQSFFPITNGALDSIGGYALRNDIRPGRLRPFVGKVFVVGLGTPRVGMRLDFDNHIRIFVHDLHQFVQFFRGVFADIGFIEIEKKEHYSMYEKVIE